MKLALRQLDRHLADGVATAYLVAGDEPLLVDEALESIRAAARARGFDSREVYAVDKSFPFADLEVQADTLSLFSSRRIVELKMASPRPGDAGSRVIAALAERRDPDRLLLVGVGGKLDSAATRAAWVKSLEQNGVVVEIWPIDRAELPRWIEQRARAAGLALTSGAAQLLAERVEGNLLAADQEIKRLALTAAGRKVDEADVLESVANNTRFDVFGLTDAVLAADADRVFKIVAGLKSEGVSPVLVSWALAREITLLARLEHAVRRGTPIDAALQRAGVWRRRQPLLKQALRRSSAPQLRSLVKQAAELDAAVKGAVPAEPWAAIGDLLLGLLRPAKA